MTGSCTVPDDTRPILVDLYSGAGGSCAGYQAAGFQVVGIDIVDQPRYPGAFIRADVTMLTLDFLVSLGAAAVHASPPCQRYSQLAHYQRATIEHRYQDLIGMTRNLLISTGLPYVIENVPGAPLRNPVELCGAMFPGINVYRHRHFEAGGGLRLSAPAHRAHVETCSRNGNLPPPGQRMTVTGGKHSAPWQRAAAAAMGVPWLAAPPGADGTRVKLGIREVCEAVPPPMFAYMGRQLMDHLTSPPCCVTSATSVSIQGSG